MQNRYVGDVGDYAKLAILRALAPSMRLGIAWWVFPTESGSNDGGNIAYLSNASKWRHYDPQVFDALARIVHESKRDISALEASGLLPGACFVSEIIPVDGPLRQLPIARNAWFDRVRTKLAECNLLFVDPDNGFQPDGYKPETRNSGKSVTLEELAALRAPGRSIIVYHHQTRRSGGHLNEINHWREKLLNCGFSDIIVLRAKSYSPRAFFILDSSQEIVGILNKLSLNWTGFIDQVPSFTSQGRIVKEAVGTSPSPPPTSREKNALFSDNQREVALVPRGEDSVRLLEELRDGLASFIIPIMDKHNGPNWMDEANKNNGTRLQRRSPDVAGLIGLIIRHWDTIFSQYLDRAMRSYAHLLKDFRNQVAHQQEIMPSDLLRALEEAVLLLRAVGASDGADRVNRRREALLSLKYRCDSHL